MSQRLLHLFRILLHARNLCWAWTFTSLLAAVPLCGADLFPEETAFRATYDASRVSLTGRVVDSSGAPVPGAGCALCLENGEFAVSGPDGTFVLPGLLRNNQVLTVTALGYYRQLVPVQLLVPLNQTNVVLPPIVLSPENSSVVRFLFGGDTAFARRMLDPEERAPRDQMPLENPGALIRVSDPLPGTLDVVGFVRPLFLAADYPVVNFESVVTLDPSTPHLQKEFVYFTLPESLPALKSLNIDYLGLGNNHVYDYLESGVSNTFWHLDQAGFHYSGMGTNSAAAFAPYRTSIKGTPYSFLAMTSIAGERFETNYVAGPDKGGAAYIESTDETRQAISAERGAGYVTVVQPHVGVEYTFGVTPFAEHLMRSSVDFGADLIVSHHTHVAQGFGMYRGVLLVHCLGNLFFDQDRLETMVGLLATVDMEGQRCRRAWGTPVYLEDYRPRLMCGSVREVLLRRISEVSKQLRVFPYNGQAWLAGSPSQYSFADRRIVLPVSVDTNGWTVVDLRNWATPEESLMRLEADTPGLTVRLGRDVMNFGDFEDVDIDGERSEASRWDFAGSTTVALQSKYRGNASLCLQRSDSNITDAVAAFRNRVRVAGDSFNTPNKDLSLVGYVRGQGAGPLSIVSRYYASEGVAEFGEEVAFDHPGGTFAWQPFVQDLHMPPDDPTRPGDPPVVNARAARVFLHHSPPATGAGYAWFDEIAIVNWEEALDPLTGPVLDTPHARDFLRVQGPPGTYNLALTFRKYRPSEADVAHGPDLTVEPEQPDQSINPSTHQSTNPTIRLSFHPTCVGFDDVLRLIVRNRGNQSLVLSNLSFVSGNGSDFLTRWISTNGSPEPGPAMTLAPEAIGRLEVRFVPTLAGRQEALLQFQSNDPDEPQSLVNVAVTGEAFTNVPVRWISRCLAPSSVLRPPSCDVHVQVPPAVSAINLLQEQLPPGVTPINISHGGQWDAPSRTIFWHDVEGRSTVSYAVTGLSGVWSISGWLASAGRLDVTSGDNLAAIIAPPDSDGDNLPDWWEQTFFDSRTGALAERDSDGDGRNNLAEFLSGTHPLDDGFQAQRLAPYLRNLGVQDQSAELQIVGSETATYRLEQSTNLHNWSSIATNLVSGETVSLPHTNNPGATSRFYRGVIEERDRD